MKWHRMHRYYLSFPNIIRLLLLIILFVFIAGIMIHLLEPKTFPTIFDGIWWSIATVSTVGYGDYSPKSILARALAIFLIFTGSAFMTYYMAILASYFIKKQNRLQEGRMRVHYENHFVIIGWNERTKNIGRFFTKTSPRHIVLIDETLPHMPREWKNLHFIKGAPYSEETLQLANVAKAKTVFISADQNQNEIHADMQTILTILSIKGKNPNSYVMAEILTKDQVEKAYLAQANEVIESNHWLSTVILNALKKKV